MKSEKDLQKLILEYSEEAIRLENEYKGLCDIIRKREIPIGQQESMEFHRNLKSVEQAKISARAKYNLLKYILEV